MRLAGRVAVVTGAARGIGAATAARLAADGATVYLTDLDGPAATELAETMSAGGHRVTGMGFDVADPDAWRRLAAQIHAEHGGTDIVVNNAYVLVLAPAHELAEADWDRQLAVDLSAVYHSVRAFLPDLRTRAGCLVNVASVHAVAGWRGHPAYAAAKGGMVALTRQLAVEYGPDVRVNAVLPGPIRTAAWDGVDADTRAVHAAGTALRRLGEPDEVAAAIAFLACGEASYITGTTLIVDGGQTAQKDPS